MAELIRLITPIVPDGQDESRSIEYTPINFDALNKSSICNRDLNEMDNSPAKRKKASNKISEVTTSRKEKKSNDDEPYSKKYEETTAQLKTAIMQVDAALTDIHSDIQQIRSSKTLKRKYDYLSMMNGSMGQFINTKVTALREINNTITKCNEFELKRAKELKADLASQANDDKALMDMYNAFISIPTSAGMPLGPSLQNITNSGAINSATIVTNRESGGDAGYADYLSRLNPSQRLMLYEDDPDVQQVVMYDEQSGSKWFEIMNLRTREVIEGVNKHDMMFMEDTTLDLDNNIARNINLGESYPIIRVGKSVMNSY